MANKGLAKDQKDLSILVTGGAGFIGRHTCVELIQRVVLHQIDISISD